MDRLSRVTATLAAGIIGIDIATKALVFATVPSAERSGPLLPLVNDAALLGVVPAGTSLLVGLAASLLLLYTTACTCLACRGRVPLWVPGIVAGGGAANLLDRAATGAVHDFLVIGGLVVNVADVALVVGLLGYWVGLLRSRPRPAAATPVRHDGRNGGYLHCRTALDEASNYRSTAAPIPGPGPDI